jgi:NAD(P)-dependent dehydrogenase (short-subunit alcohol dehydrogenase family)
MDLSERFSGKVALVTGAAEGIGFAIAHRLRREGARVVVADLSKARLEAAFRPHDGFHLIEQDITINGAAEGLVTAAIEAFDGLDIVVNNAGMVKYESTETMSDATWNRTLDVNITAVFKICRAAIPQLRASTGGRIINIASINALRTTNGLVAYAATKAAVGALTKTLAVELGSDRITANYILPGAILTGMTRPLMEASEDTKRLFESYSVLGRIGLPADIAAAVAFLASEDASFITGHGLAVDGGFLAKV